MTEHLSFFEEEQSSDMPQTDYVDLLAQPTWSEFVEEAKQVEFSVSDYNPDDEDDCLLVAQRASDLDEKIGTVYIGRRAAVTGMGYAIYSENSSLASNQPTFINTKSASYHGVNVCFFEGRWQAMLEVYCAEHSDETPSGLYNILPDKHHLMTLNIDTIDDDAKEDDDDQGVIQNLKEDFKSAQTFVYGGDFTRADPVAQRMLLQDITASANREVSEELRGKDVVVACTRYYTAYDNMHYTTHDDPIPGFDLRDFLTDLSDTPPEERYALNGEIVGFEYPELKILPLDQLLSAATLNLNEGSYCLVLRSEREGATHYVLPQTITDIY